MSAENSDEAFILLAASEIDIDRIILKDPETQTFKTGTSSVTSKAVYKNEADEEVALFIRAPTQFLPFGVSYKYDMDFKPEKGQQHPDKAKGLQICYPMTSMETIRKPTTEEKAFTILLDKLWTLACQQGQVEAARKPLLIPNISKSSYVAAKAESNMRDFVKYPIQPYKPKPDDRTQRPDNMYINLVTRGQGNDMKVVSKIYGNNPEPLPQEDFINVRGKMEPCIKFEGLYWGAHGKNSHGCSLRLRVMEANFWPSPGFNGGVPKQRVLSRGAPPLDMDSGEQDQPPVPMPRRNGKPPVRTAPPQNNDETGGEDDADPLEAILKPAPKPAKPTVRPAPAKKQAPPILKKAPPKPKVKAPPPPEPEPEDEAAVEDEEVADD